MKQEPSKRIVMMADCLDYSSLDWQEPDTTPRVVSIAEYALARERRKGLAFNGLVLCIVTAICSGVLIFNIVNIMNVYWRPSNIEGLESLYIVIYGFMCILFGFIACIAGWYAKKTIKAVAVTNPAILFTIADLPAVDSLVRASQKPLQAKETVLLRAASKGAQTREEELLRATAGRQE